MDCEIIQPLLQNCHSEFVKEAVKGGKGNLPMEATPVLDTIEPWDGKDGRQIFEEDEMPLDEVMNEF